MQRTVPNASLIDRPLGATENIYWLLDKLYCLNFVVFAELEGRLDADRLQAALATVQAENPLLRARIVRDGGRNWFKPAGGPAAALQLQVLRLTQWRRQIEAQLHLPFEPAQAPLARFLWFQGAGRKSALAMCFHHAIADGRSGTAVFLDVLRRAAVDGSPARPRKAHASSQSLDLILQKAPVAGALQGLRFWLAKGKDALQFAQQLPGYDPTPRALRKIRVLPLPVEPALLPRLLAQARRHGTTLHGALGAAQLLAVNQQFGRPAARRLGLNSLADLRSALNGGLDDQDLGLYITTLCTVHTVGTAPDFWPLAGEIRGALKQIIDAGDANLINGVYPSTPTFDSAENTAKLVQSIVALAPPSTMLTNIGKIDEVDLGEAGVVKSLGFVVSPPAQHPVCVTAASYGGRLCMHLLYDETKIASAQAHEIGDSLLAHLAAAASGK